MLTPKLTTLVVKFDVPGFHNWPNPPEKYAYLGHPHRHLFHFEVECIVTEDNRQIEFIEFKSLLTDLAFNTMSSLDVNEIPYELDDHLHFGGRSCEMIAKEFAENIQILFKDVRLNSVLVTEDDENGSKIYF